MRLAKYQERRKHTRKSCSVAVKGLVWDSAFKALAKNISLGGAFIETPYAFATGDPDLQVFATKEKVFLMFFARPPHHDEPIHVPSNVVWNRPDGFGVEFMDTPDRLEAMIEAL